MKIPAVFVLPLLFLSAASGAFAQEFVVAYVGGAVNYERAKIKKPLRRQDTVREGDIVTTGPSAFAALRTEDGTVIKVAGDTTFEVKKIKSTASERIQIFNLTRGKILASISKLKKETSIDWYTPTAIAGVRGTIFILEVQDKTTTLYVTEGSVSFGKDARDKKTVIKEKQMAVLGQDEKKPAVRDMSKKDLENALKGIPVMLVIDNNRVGSAPQNDQELKNELRKNLQDQKARQAQDREKYSEKSFWDSETGRVIRVGDTTYTVVERFKKTGDSVRYFSTTENRNNQRLSIMDMNAYFKDGVPSLASAVGGGDVRSATRESLTVGAKLPGKRGDLLEINIDNTSGTSVNSARISSYSDPNKVFQGSEFQTATIGNEDYIILTDGGVEAYRFRIGTRVVDVAGKEILLTPSMVNVNNLLKLLKDLGQAAIYMYWIPVSGGTGAFYSGQIEIVISAQYLPMMLLNSLISF